MDKKLKLIVVLFFVGLAGIIYFSDNISGFNNEGGWEDAQAVGDFGEDDYSKSQIVTDEVSKGSDNVSEYQVYICGCVVKPGVYKLAKESRLYEYLELAGGYTKSADTQYENLARIPKDGEKVYFPSKEESLLWKENPTTYPLDNASNKNNTDTVLVNINTADEKELTKLSGIGESRAKSIIAYRQTNGSFKTKEDIMLVNGIKESVYEKIKEYITV